MENVQRLVSPNLGIGYKNNRNGKHLMELKNIVYITTNTLNGDFYIGVHRTNPEIFDGYIGNNIYNQSCATETFKFHAAVRKYGYSNFRRTTIQIFPDTEEGRKQALLLEASIVTPTLLKSKHCYNMVVGGGGGERESCNKRVYMFSLDGNFLRSFKNTRAAAEYVVKSNTNYTVESIRSCIKNVCVGTSNSCCNLYFSYKKEFLYIKNKNIKEVAQYTYNGKFLRKWSSVIEASENFKCDVSQAILKNGTAGGYRWAIYRNDSDIKPLYNYTTNYEIRPIIIAKGRITKVYNNVNECVKDNPYFNKSQIMKVLKGKIKTHLGWFFKYKDEDIV